MGILAKLFGAVPKAERDGIHLVELEPWEISPTNDVARFLRALPLIAPGGANVYFEDTAESHVAKYLEEVAVAAPVQVAVGTIWPRPDCYHVPLTQQAMDEMASFLERTPAGFFCTHCHVYAGDTVLLEWHDAFGSDPMYVSRTIDAPTVERFAQVLGLAATTRRR